jgi:predicted RNA-binding protein with TRAM domain
MLFKAEAQVGDRVKAEVQKVINERLLKFVRAVNG